jgi:hypothetical protein
MELVMKLTKTLPVIATGLTLLISTSFASASTDRSCDDIALHAEKLTLQAERYQQRAAELNPGEHDNEIRALKRRGNSMREKAIELNKSCEVPKLDDDKDKHEHHHFDYD